MKRLAPAVLSAGLLVMASCGGDSASSVATESESASSAIVATTGGTAVPSSEVTVSEVPMAPVELLVDPSYDIEAIDGPVVLWFWAPG